MKKILLIATGGTIASAPTKNGLAPQITSEEILGFVPEIKDIADVTAIQLFNVDSSNVHSKHWVDIAKCIAENYDSYDGFVVTHGTDTMAYSASAIGYLVQDSKKPIVFTGSQKSIYMRDTDARNNLYNAFVYAVHPKACLVHIVFEDKIIIGCRARKTKTKSYNAFDSVDFPEVGVIRDGKVLLYIEETVEKSTPTFYFEINPRVFVFKLVPGVDLSIFPLLKNHYDAIILESFGVGNIPLYDDEAFTSAIADWVNSGKTLVITTQVPHEGSDMSVYETGYTIKEKFGVIEAYNMPSEAVVTKLMWILARTKEPEEIKRLFYKSVQKDIL